MRARVVFKVSLALVCWCIAGTLAIIEVTDLIDPTGSKMSDDGDPFGPPHTVTWQELAVVVPIIVLFSWIAYRLFNHAFRDGKPIVHHEEHTL